MLYTLFSEQSQRYSNRTAIIWKDEEYSYQALANAVSERCTQLKSTGIEKGATIALLVPNSPEFVINSLAAWALGCTLLPLNVAYTPEEIEKYLLTSHTQLVIKSAGSELPNAVTEIKSYDVDAACFPEAPDNTALFPAVSLTGDCPAIVMFSSGSTGTPKQVVRTQANLMTEIESAKISVSLTENDIILCCVPLFHAHGLANCFLAAIMNGGTLLINNGEFNPRKVAGRIANFRVTILPFVPFMAKMLAMTPFKQQPDLSSLRIAYTAGAVLDQEISEAFIERFGIRLGQLYGSTETGAAALNTSPDDTNYTSTGKPLSGISISIIDDDGNPVATGESGEIIINTAAMATEYTGLEELSAETFQADGYHTGDLGHFDDAGYLNVTGRKKLMINVAGNKVDPLDIERVVSSIPGVTEVVALGKPDALTGEAVKVAIVASDDSLSAEYIRDHCATHLVDYKVPRIIEFIDEIPKNPLGKILRKYL